MLASSPHFPINLTENVTLTTECHPSFKWDTRLNWRKT